MPIAAADKPASPKARASWFIQKPFLAVLALLFAAAAVPCAWNVVSRSEAYVGDIDQILRRHNLQNEATQTLDEYAQHHPILGTLFLPPVKSALKLPSEQASDEALHAEVPHLLKSVRRHATEAAWWSCLLLNLSFLYVVAVVCLERGFTERAVLFALTAVGVVFFVVGIVAPAMIIWTAPSIPVETGKLQFVLQHEVRGIAAVIRELFTSGHWVIAGFLFLFSIVTPLTKATLTFFITGSASAARNFRIGNFLHAIGKWSMADVFVAGVILALYALKSQQATKSIPCVGLDYFIGYCLLSMTTTELLMHSDAVGARKGPQRSLGGRGIALLVILFLAFAAGSTAFTYERYVDHPNRDVTHPLTPSKGKNDLDSSLK